MAKPPHMEQTRTACSMSAAGRLPPARVVEQLREAAPIASTTLVRDPDPSKKVAKAFIVAHPASASKDREAPANFSASLWMASARRG